MTIKATVQQALSHMPGNKPFKGTTLMQHILKQDNDTKISVSQVMRALRDIPYVQSDGRGNYIIRGRRV